MDLVLYNTLARRKERFAPLEEGRVGMYVCGPTVYDRAHIGNARPVIAFDVLYRLLKRLYRSVTYVRNITDVDDKINAAAKETGEPISVLAKRTIDAFHEDIARLNTLAPDVEPRATEHIPEMVALIERLLATNHAYQADGHVLFHVPSMADYGKLSHRDRREMIAGARVEVAPYKRDPADFVLWKPSPPELPGWESPWGRGRPGWHIECSAMSQHHLGETLDIHGGGSDLIFPHHENEIAQSECAHGGKTFVRYWVHNGFLSVDGEKMSKSLGNIVTIGDALDQAPGEAIRLLMLSTHYRHPLDWSEATLRQAKANMDRLYTALRDAEVEAQPAQTPPEPVMAALADDLNTPVALAALHELATRLNKAGSAKRKRELKAALLAGGEVLGLLQREAEAWFKWQPAGAREIDERTVEEMVTARSAARQQGDFAKADRIREELRIKYNIVLEDRPEGTRWRPAG